MKKLISLFVVAFLCTTTMFASDATIVSNWMFPITYYFPDMPVPAGGIANYPRAQAIADSIGDFDPVGVVFDDVWATLNQGVSGEGYPVGNQVGNAKSAKGTTDFSGAFKVVYDQSNIYILLKYYDDVIDGREVVELMWTPYLSIPEIATLPSVLSITNKPVAQTAPYARYSQFGGNKASFTNKGYRDACIVQFDATGTGNILYSGTNALLTNNLSYDNKTELGSHTVRAIYTIGFQTLTGNAYAAGLNARPTFDNKTWRTLNGGKGITFDIKIADTDPDDQLNSEPSPKEQPAEYWWNTTSNDGWALSFYSGFLGVRGGVKTAVNPIYVTKPAIFGNVTSTIVELTQNANVEVFNSVGKSVVSLKNTNKIDLTNLQKGVYVISANNETMKFSR